MKFSKDSIGTRGIHYKIGEDDAIDTHAYYHVNGDLYVNGVKIHSSDLCLLIRPLLYTAWQQGKLSVGGDNPYSESYNVE